MTWTVRLPLPAAVLVGVLGGLVLAVALFFAGTAAGYAVGSLVLLVGDFALRLVS